MTYSKRRKVKIMKNKYTTFGTYTFIFCNQRGHFEGIWIDTSMLPIAKSFEGTWCIKDDKNTKYAFIHTLIDGKATKVYLHRVLLKPPVNSMIDHINGNGLDNRLCNLNIVSNGENQQNKRISRNNTSGVKGISLNKRAHKWEVRLQINKQNLYLGLYDSIDEAKKVRDEAETKYFTYLAGIDDSLFN